MKEHDAKAPSKKRSTRWKRPTLTYVGDVPQLVAGGGGKLSPMFADKGDTRKPAGQG